MANVLITGCSSGFGLLSALHFARQGDTVYASMRDTSKAGELERQRDAEKLPIHIVQLDVVDDASVRRCVNDVVAKAGSLDVVVNNAGAELQCPIEEADDDEMQWQFDTNVFGTVRVIRAALPHMRAQGRGTIVNLSSLTGVVGTPYGGMYSATKHAIEAITEALHFEVQPFGIRVALVEPGRFDTNFGANIRRSRRFADDASPYRERHARFEKALDKLSPEGAPAPDPQDVAVAIYNAAYGEKPQLRHVVGNDAKLVSGVHKALDFEGFEQAMRQTLDWYD